MGLFREITISEQAFLKAGLYGGAGTGKTYSAVSLALGVHQWIGSDKPVAFLDTETGSDYQLPRFQAAGIRLLVAKTRAFSDLMEAIKEASKAVDVLIIDTLSHYWDELTRAYLRSKRDGTKFIRLQDWQPIKEQWRLGFAEPYVSSKMHIIWCARSANVFEDVEDTEVSRQLGQTAFKSVKVGTKARSESESSYEPSLLLEMERVYRDGDGRFVRRCQVIKDRWGIIDGKEFDDPTFDAFLPHVRLLNLGGPHVSVDVERTSDAIFTDGHERNYHQRRKAIETLLAELEGLYHSFLPGSGAKEKKLKADIAFVAFGKRSWDALKNLRLEDLQAGYQVAEYILARLDGVPDEAKELAAWLHQQKISYLESLLPGDPSADDEDVGDFSGPKQPQESLEATPISEATIIPFDRDDGAQGQTGISKGIPEEMSPTMTTTATDPVGSIGLEDISASVSGYKRVQDYAERHGLGKDLNEMLSQYPDGITERGLAGVLAELQQRVATQEGKVKSS